MAHAFLFRRPLPDPTDTPAPTALQLKCRLHASCCSPWTMIRRRSVTIPWLENPTSPIIWWIASGRSTRQGIHGQQLAEKIKAKVGRSPRIGACRRRLGPIDADDVMCIVSREVELFKPERMWASVTKLQRVQSAAKPMPKLRSSFRCCSSERSRPRRIVAAIWDLERNLSSLVSRSSADVGVAVLDLRTGQKVSVPHAALSDGENR